MSICYERARAIYSDSDIFIFDDSLSAVDGTVAKNIISKYELALVVLFQFKYFIYF